jgi:hypothetical protein
MNTPTPEKMGNAALQQGSQMLSIIKQSAEREGIKDFDKFVRQLATLMQDKNNKLVQFGNTVFLFKRINPTTAELHTFSSEPPPNLISAFQGAAKMLQKSGIKKVVSYADSPAYVKLVKQAGLPVKVSQGAKVIKGQAKPVYTFELNF